MSTIEYVPDDSFSQSASRNHFGRLKIILKNSLCTVTVGPDYHYFLPTFSFCLVVGLMMIKMVFSSSPNAYFRAITVMVCLGQPLAYLVVALSNPGIVSHSIIDIPSDEVQMNTSSDSAQLPSTTTISPKRKPYKKKYCKKCQIHVKPTTFHCKDCALCIEEYDHHCPWVSKCIGKGNLGRFYFFLAMTPIFMIFVFVAFFICATINLAERGKMVPT